MAFQKEFLEMIEADIKRIDESITSGTDMQRWELFREIDGKYQSCIADFYKGMWQSSHSSEVLYFNKLKAYPNEILENLKMAKAKLEVFRYGANATSSQMPPSTNVSVTTNVNVSVTFEQVRSQIEDMTALSREQTDEILEKINELEEISKEKSSRKTKWEKVRPIIAFALDKGADVAIAILSLVMQMKLGM
ncbi:MAG: hypothetical protein MSF41_03555 [Oscillibacter sp.]|nr:hypothetical protein [Oscillibacter sp.]